MTDDRQIKSYVWHGKECFFVSTITRESSSPEGGAYNETMVWPYDWAKGERDLSFIFQDGDHEGSIRLHMKVCERLFETGKPEDQDPTP